MYKKIRFLFWFQKYRIIEFNVIDQKLRAWGYLKATSLRIFKFYKPEDISQFLEKRGNTPKKSRYLNEHHWILCIREPYNGRLKLPSTNIGNFVVVSCQKNDHRYIFVCFFPWRWLYQTNGPWKLGKDNSNRNLKFLCPF